MGNCSDSEINDNFRSIKVLNTAVFVPKIFTNESIFIYFRMTHPYEPVLCTFLIVCRIMTDYTSV